MSEPIDEQIAEYIKARISEITTANGFNQTLTAIRPKMNDFSDVVPANGTVLVWQMDEETGEQPTFSTDEWQCPFLLMAIVLGTDGTTGSLDTLLNRVKTDIRKKLAGDRKMGGLCDGIDLNVPAKKFDDGMGFSGIAVPVVVRYATAAVDPYQKA